MSTHSYGFYLSKWESEKSKIIALRQNVLFKELGIAANSLENNNDPESFHVIAYNDASEPIGTGCINTKGQLGYLIVMNQWRRRRVGMAIVKYLFFIAKRLNLSSVSVESPEAAVSFYLSAGFEKTDHSFVQDGIHYCKLIKTLENTNPIVH